MRRLGKILALAGAMMALAAGCGDPQPPVVSVGVNVVEKSAFTGSWYMARVVVDMEYEGAPLEFVGDGAEDNTGGYLGFSVPRIRWVIDENFLYAYRDYELVGNPDDPRDIRGEDDPNYLGQPVAAFRILSHFDIRREYNAVTREEFNTIVENTTDRHWYERQFMRVDWSQNMIVGYWGNQHNLGELFGTRARESSNLFVQDVSQFPDEYRPQFHFMSCTGADDTNCARADQDWASDYEQNTLYSMSFVTQELVYPGSQPYGFPLCRWSDEIEEYYPDVPECASVAVWIRTSFLRVSDRRDYNATDWTLERFDRAGFWHMDRATYDRATVAGDPSFGFTDYTNRAVLRHNIWSQWFQRDDEGNIMRDAQGRAIELPYSDRERRKIIWYSSSEVPSHLVKPSYEIVSEWNTVFMGTVRQLRGDAMPEYPAIACQEEDPGRACYCQRDPETDIILNETCAGEYDPFESPQQAADRGVVEPFDCYVAVIDENGAPIQGMSALSFEPDWNDQGLSSSDFEGWWQTAMVGSECINVLHLNTCNMSNRDQWGELDCEQRGDIRFKLLSFVDQPGTPFLGVAQLRGDPITGEIITGDANIGGPAMNVQRTRALEAYDLINGNIAQGEFYTGEDIRAYLNAVGHVEIPAPPRIDFSVAQQLRADVDPAQRNAIHARMEAAMARAEMLQGPEGRAGIYSDRLSRLAGTELEAGLMSGPEAYAMAGFDYVPSAMSVDSPGEAIVDRGSPFRTDLSDRLEESGDFQLRLALRNMIMPNEFTDDSVLAFVNQHRNWSRVRVEFELDRRLYRETQVHEMGHCIGLRHDFGGTADHGNYEDGYYTINENFPLPDPNDFNLDGVPGLNPEEQVAFEDAYETMERRRELAGIDQWMNASVMDYTPNFYQRINGAGRYDNMAIAFGYGDIVDIYDNSYDPSRDQARPPLAAEDINPVNTRRVGIKFYAGGETCTTDADCPYSTSGSRSGDLLDSNTASGLTQRCVPSPRTEGVNVCSSYDDDAAAMLETAGANPAWMPVPYMYCDDYRRATRTMPHCNWFDEGDSFRAIVHNQAEAYERDYLFSAFRRYRRQFGIGTYFDRLFRFIDPLLAIYQNLIYRYATEPEFREQEGSFGFYDEFLATADIMNLFARMLAQPSIGSYQWSSGWERYELSSLDVLPNAQVTVPLGQGRFLNSIYQSGLEGLWRIERVGSIYDSILAMQLMTFRGLGLWYGSDVMFFTNFYDIFPNEMQQIFTGMIAARPEEYMPRLECSNATGNECEDQRMVFMDFYRGDCTPDPDTGIPNPATCRANPTSTYQDLRVLNGGTRFFLQSYAAIFSLANFPIYHDTTFQNQMFVCVEGQGDCFAPEGDATDYVRFTSRRFGKNFLAWRVDSPNGDAAQTSIAYAMVTEARDLEFIVRMLRTYRGDFGGGARDINNLTVDERNELARIGYTLPATDAAIQTEINRLEPRVLDLESFFFYLIQLERAYGIDFPSLWARPEL
jgi:hypothetical protein